MVRNGCFWIKFESQEIKTIKTKILRVSKKIHLDPMTIFSVVLNSLYEQHTSQKVQKPKNKDLGKD